MSGSYIQGQSKTLSGVYTLIQVRAAQPAQGNRGIVAYPFVSDWGPVNELTPITQASDFARTFNGQKTTKSASIIHKHAWNGSPQKILGWRIATSAAAKGTVALNDSDTDLSLGIETLYPSARAFNAVVKEGLTPGTVTVQILEGSALLIEVTGDTVESLSDQLNASDYVRVTDTGTNLPAVTAGVGFAGGNDGAQTVTADDYQKFLDELEADATANAFALDAVSDDALVALAETWTNRVRKQGVLITFVRGGSAAWDTDGGTAANTKSKALNSRGIVNVGNGVDGYPASEMAIYVAARVASVPLNQTLTDEPLNGYSKVNKKLTVAQRETAKLAGTLMFVTVGGVVQIDEGVNTLTVPHDDSESASFGKIRVNNAIDSIVKDLEDFGNLYKRTRSNTQQARQTFAAAVEQSYFRGLAAQEIIQPGYFYLPDPEYHGDNPIYNAKLDEAYFTWGVLVVDAMEKIYQRGLINF